MAWTTTDLLADVRRRAMLPTTATQGTTDADLLAHANNEMASRMVPLVQSVNEEFYVQTVDVPFVAGQAAYRFPDRNSGAKLRDVLLILGNAQLNLARIEPEQLTRWVANSVGTPAAFYLEAGTLNLVPLPGGSGVLRTKYYVRPGQFTNAATDYGVITSVTYTGANTVNIAYSGSLAATNGGKCDVIAYRPPFEYLLVDATVSNKVGSNLTLTITSPTTPPPNFSPNIAVGDYITLSDKSPIMQLPVELQSLLAQRVVCAVMETFNYSERHAAAEAVYEKMHESALKLITPRVDGAPKKMRGILSSQRRVGWVGW